MEIATTYDELKHTLKALRATQQKIALIPTMGNLHSGHLHLLSVAQKMCEYTVVSIFVNKKQFGENEDFKSYPRTLEADVSKLKEHGATLAYIPANSNEIYGDEFALSLDVPHLTNILCGISRPNFFKGVLAVVFKLFLQVLPDAAIFGKKDYQQFKVVSALAASMGNQIEVIGVETIRDLNGLALSSRNNYFSKSEQAKLSFIYNILMEMKLQIKEGAPLSLVISNGCNNLYGNGIEKIDYLEILSQDLLPLLKGPYQKGVIFFAGFYNKVRLIDNIEFEL